jgi:hypothetical protein
LKKKNKVLFIDVGTHEGQEIKALTGSALILFLLFLKRYIINFFTRGNIAPSFIDILSFFSTRKKLIKNVDFCFVTIEPNWRNYDSNIYKKIDYAFCLGLQKIDNNFEFKNFSYKNTEKKCQGASLLEKPSSSDLTDIIPVVDPDYFCEHILQNIVNEYNYEFPLKIILRLNCEGTEDEVIYSINKKFSGLLVGILGSLDDVKKKKGRKKAEVLDKYLNANSIDFCRFSSNMITWPKTIRFLHNKLN